MRIVLFPSAYAPAFGGVEELTARLAANLTAAGHTVQVWVHRFPEGVAPSEVIDQITVRRFDLVLPAMNLAALSAFAPRGRAALRALRQAAVDFNPDVIHVQCFSNNGIYATALARLTGTRLVLSLQGETVMDDADIYSHSATLRQGLRWGLRRADVVTGCSNFVLEDARTRFGLGSGSGQVIPNGVDMVEAATAEPLELPFRRFVVAYGRVVPKKGFDRLVEAFARVARTDPAVGLLIGGDGASRAGLEDRAQALGISDRVRFAGRLSRGQVLWATQHASLFVLPSRVEPFGIVVLEAMRAGLPVIVSSAGGAPDIVREGIEGYVVDPTDTTALADRMGQVLADPALAGRLGAAGAQRVHSYDWRAITEQYAALY
jgi:glycogen(starch) synthase